MKKEGALPKIGEGEIDNQWFKGAKMTIVPRPMQDRLMVSASDMHKSTFGDESQKSRVEGQESKVEGAVVG